MFGALYVSMNRIFQDTYGNIDALKGRTISSLISVNDSEDVILFWFGEKDTNVWWRAFIDGAYCGIDEYLNCEIEEDLDESLLKIDYSSKLNSGIIESVSVSNPMQKDGYIVLSLKLENQLFELVCKSNEGDCVLKFNV